MKECPWCEGDGVISDDGRDLNEIMLTYRSMFNALVNVIPQLEEQLENTLRNSGASYSDDKRKMTKKSNILWFLFMATRELMLEKK